MKQITNVQDLAGFDSLDYRGFHIDFYLDEPGQQYWTIWEGQEIGFGSFNNFYKEDMQKVIDDKLDIITRFDTYEDFWGAKLSWFENGDYEDIKLIYKGRIIKIYLIADKEKINLQTIIDDAIKCLIKIGAGKVED